MTIKDIAKLADVSVSTVSRVRGDLSRGDGGSDGGSCGHPRGGDHGRNGDNSPGRADADGRNDRVRPSIRSKIPSR